MYSIASYGQMIADSVRMEAYGRALRQCIQPSSVVVDVGAGTGVFSLLACQYGARRVYAIEPDDSISVARAHAAANGYADRIVFVQDLSTRVSLPERADVIVSDLHGLLPLFRGHLLAIVDARKRLMVAGGVLIPRRDTVWAAVVEAPEVYSRVTGGYVDNGYGLNLEAALLHTTSTFVKARFSARQLLVEPTCWATLDYPTVTETNVRAGLSWSAQRAGTGHGLSLWFDSTLIDGVSFSNAPGKPELIYGNAFFPWSRPVSLQAGDRVEVSLRADLVGTDYVWSWDSRVFAKQSPGQIKAAFQQSTFFRTPLVPARLRKQAAEHVPALNADGQIDRLILEMMDGQASVGDIARQLCDRFPAQFGTWQDALARVGDLSQRYSR